MVTRMIFVFALASVIVSSAPASAATTVRVASGLTRPVDVASAPDDFQRLFIVEQGGLIRILKNGAVLPNPFLNLTTRVSCCGERGLLGLAFHPDYQNNGYFYVNYTQFGTGGTIIARFSVSANPDSADTAGQLILKTVVQPEPNHNGGCLQFGPDGMLYAGMGDGGGANDQHGTIGNGQAPSTLLGKLLRLDVNLPTPYVPADNPFVGAPDTLSEIWAFGLRNPWRFSFDRLTGNLYIADVGQNQREEVDFQPASSPGGENYGWRCLEGTRCTGMTGCACDDPGLAMPVHEYTHSDGISITGGYVYRGCAVPDLVGAYVFADYGSGRIWSFRYDGISKNDFRERTVEFDPPGAQAITNISSFGEDAFGELYIADYADGEIYKIIPNAITDCNANNIADSCEITLGLAADADEDGIPDQCEGPCVCGTPWGDVNSDGARNPVDVVRLVNYVYKGDLGALIPPPSFNCPRALGDVTCDDTVMQVDVVAMVNVVYRGQTWAICADPCSSLSP